MPGVGQRPFIAKGVEGSWWIVTGYHIDADSDLVIDERWDCTEQMEQIGKAEIASAIHPMGRQN